MESSSISIKATCLPAVALYIVIAIGIAILWMMREENTMIDDELGGDSVYEGDEEGQDADFILEAWIAMTSFSRRGHSH